CDFGKSRFARVFSSPSEYTSTIALSDTYNASFLALGASATTSKVSAVAPTNIGFIHLNRRSLQLHVRFGQQRANLLKHSPSSFVGHSSFALDLLSGNAATGRSHQIHCVEPQAQRSSGFLKDGSCKWVDVIPAMIASVSSATRDAVMLPLFAALFTVCQSVRKSLFFQKLKAEIIIRKFFVELFDGVSKFFRDGLSAIHGLSPASAPECHNQPIANYQ